MNSVNEEKIKNVLRKYKDPYLNQDPVTAGCLREITITGGCVSVYLEIGYSAGDFKREWSRILEDAIQNIPGVAKATVDVQSSILGKKNTTKEKKLKNIKNIIAISSSKGGVGKSTISANIALSLAKEGSKVGILDADIYGPSQDIILGVNESRKKEIYKGKDIIPIKVLGIELMSIALLSGQDVPIIWRGPMASTALMQLLTQTLWSDLDYLIIDMPPGTGDIQLTLAQKIPLSGALIVVTPQDMVVSNVSRGVEMFRKLRIPILGFIENMGVYTCPHCSHSEHIFGKHGGKKISEKYGVEHLASFPLSKSICEQSNKGVPIVLSEPKSEITVEYQRLVRIMTARISQMIICEPIITQ